MKDNIEYSEFERLELRVGKIIDASLPEWSDKLIRYEVEFGEKIGRRVMFSGIRAWYSPDDLKGRRYIFVLNMKPKKMGPETSEGMMIMADTKKRPMLLEVDSEIEIGEVVR